MPTSRDVFLRPRAPSSRKWPTHTKSCPSTTSVQDILPIIKEEDETRASTASSPLPRQCSPNSPSGSQLKLKRRHANLTVDDIWLAKTALSDTSDSAQDSGLLALPRPAPRPPAPSPSFESSPDRFSLDSSVGSFRFPHPPISPSFDHYCTGSESPTPSMSSCSSTTSPETQSPPLPRTPSSSDDEFYHDFPTPSFNPRPVIIKPLVITKHNRPAVSHGSRTSISPSLSKIPPKCPLPPPPMSEDDSDSESDSEWYSRELSKTVTLCSPTLPNWPSKVRPDSVFISGNPSSSPIPPTPTTPTRGLPSAQLDPSFPRRHIRVSIPNYPPPPVPTSSKSAKTSRPRSNLLIVTPPCPRPPPRSSIPADCVLVDDTFTFSDDDASVFSLSLYDNSPLPSARHDSPKSAHSQQSFQSPRLSPFPPSFPSTPSSAFPSAVEDEFDFPVEDIQFNIESDHPVILPLDLPTSPFDFEADLTSRFEQLRNVSDGTSLDPTGVDSRELRSRWSSSTLGSVREEHPRRSAIGLALRAYFGSSPSAKSKTRNSSSSGRLGSPIPKTLTQTARRHKETKRESDVMVIGYGYGAQHS
ncbi:hypothetical protein C0995_013560 [Termitomyces sp. Mi166|nr:hypothetical protein C0995_013560 [Termitomyces sp. Mi166\